ncbi:MAG: hypothetical protein V4683_14875 [Bacteroidota bacterium]
MKFKANSTLIILLILGLLLVLFKFSRFHTLSYFLDDFTNNLEGSYSWMLGRPLTFANGFGKLNTAHNYFLMPFLGPIALYFGAKGIFVFLVLCIFTAWVLFFKIEAIKSPFIFISFAFLLLNPTFFWIFDHPDVGWCIELLYFPFAVLFAISIKSAKNVQSICFAILLISVREEGIILVSMIHLSYMILQLESFTSALKSRKIWLYGLGYSALFVVSMLYLASKGNSNSFVESAFSVLKSHQSDSDFYFTNLKYFGHGLLLISPFIAFYLFFQPYKSIHFFVFCSFLLLLFGLIFFQTIRYFDLFFFQIVSLTWAARFILPFTFATAFLILNLPENSNIYQGSLKKSLLFSLFFVQFMLISFVRKDVSYSEIINGIISNEPQHRIKNLLNQSDLRIIREIEEVIPERSSVYVGDYLVPIFSNHFIVWPDRYKEFEKADIGIIPISKEHIHLRNELPLVMKQGYKSIGTVGDYEVFAIQKYQSYIDLKKLLEGKK